MTDEERREHRRVLQNEYVRRSAAKRRAAGIKRKRKRYPCVCALCDTPFTSVHSGAKYCCAECIAVGVSLSNKSKPRPSLHLQSARSRRRAQAARRLKMAERGRRGEAVWYSGRCVECGEWFVGHAHGKDLPRFCSDKCKSAAIHTRRRARQHGVEISKVRRYLIYERDDWVCQLCGEPVNRAAHFLDNDYPSLDHITALATGGDHTEDNLWTTHRLCNSIKGAGDWALVA
jgi:hypothetical protein